MLNVNSKEFYMWAYNECVKTNYEWWGIDMMSMYQNIKASFPNAAEAIKRCYTKFDDKNYTEASAKEFKNPQIVYEAIMSLLPQKNTLRFDTRTKEQSKEFKEDNMCSWNKYVLINKIDLVAAIFLFTEEFIFEPLSEKNIFKSRGKLIVYGNFVTFKISRHIEKTYISILIRDYMLLEYVILN